jgi:hypothetical protein
MTQRIVTAMRIAVPIAILALVALAAQAGQRWPWH